MKKIFTALAFFGLFLLTARIAGAQYYGPYPYYPYPYAYGTPYDDPSQYDPYYELHTMHYQLYLNPYGYYPYWGAPVIVTPPAPPRVVVRPPPATRGNVPPPAAK
jgi:hypothetical protein